MRGLGTVNAFAGLPGQTPTFCSRFALDLAAGLCRDDAALTVVWIVVIKLS
jgi:hypothetical protein